jgi:hypothetical protein
MMRFENPKAVKKQKISLKVAAKLPEPPPVTYDYPAEEPTGDRIVVIKGKKHGTTISGKLVEIKKESSPPEPIKKKSMSEAKSRLPKQIVPIANADKSWHEKWYEGRDLLNIPHPFRAVLMGPPNSGKTTVVKNILMRADPPFTRMVVIYPDGGGFTDEYEDCGELEMLGHIPPPEDWDGKQKTLCVIDDFELKSLSKSQRSNLDRLVGHVSTHRNVSVCVCNQDPYNAPPIVRRCANLMVLWKPKDMVSMQTFASRTGENLRSLFNTYAKSRFDSIWIDMTVDSPAPRRLNGYTII